MVGIIGTSGSGKSTILDLLLGFAQPSSGSVSLDGQFCRLSVHGWEGEVGYVPQSIFLTDDSVRRNVALGVPDGEIDDQAVILALSRARLLDWVQSLPRGLDTLIGEGGSLISGGERQRLGVARALYRLPQVLFLDEATSALDAGTEAALMRDIESMAATMTIIVVSHRDRPLKACDLVYQVADGNVTLVRRHDSQANNSLELVPDT
jgi:ABC-type bacteriocin/lantibiotic exporter with double-glycine peptidase domain